MGESGQLIVFTTIDDAVGARRLADSVVGAGLAACVNILPEITSVFRWQPDAADAAHARVQAEGEVLLLIKTSARAYPELESHIQREHPYDLPEVIAVSVEQGSAAFRQWIDASTRA